MKNFGSTFESIVEMVCDAYHAQGRAYFEKVAPPTKVIQPPGFRAKVILLENPFLDFTGTWTERGGKAIHLEAKSTEAPRLPVGNDAGVSAEQLAALEKWDKAGAAVGVLWHHQGQVRFVTLSTIHHAKTVEERASVSWKKAYPIPEGDGFIHFDFLAVLSALYPCAAR